MDEMPQDLRCCPFCGGFNTQIHTDEHWTGMRSIVLCATAVHYCERQDGQPQSIIKIKGRTTEEAVDAWNTRAF